MKRILLGTGLLIGLAVSCAGGAIAAPITYNFYSAATTENLGSSNTYTAGGVTITEYSGSLSGSTITRGGVLVGNNRGTDEQGLGVCVGSGSTCAGSHFDNNPEIDYSPREVVQLDITNLLTAGYTSLSVNADSATDGEKLDVYTSTTSSGLGTLLATIATVDGNVSIVQNGNYLNFIADNNSGGADVLLHSLTADKPVVSVAEPASLGLLGASLLGMGLTRRRRAQPTASA